MFMILPLFCFIITGETACIKLNADFKFTLITISHWASDIRIIRPSRVIPALFTKMSMRPKSFTISVTTLCVSSKFAAFEAYPFTFTPKAAISASVAFALSSMAKSVNAISAPSFANLIAIALPIPRAAPVITATFPCNNFISYLIK